MFENRAKDEKDGIDSWAGRALLERPQQSANASARAGTVPGSMPSRVAAPTPRAATCRLGCRCSFVASRCVLRLSLSLLGTLVSEPELQHRRIIHLFSALLIPTPRERLSRNYSVRSWGPVESLQESGTAELSDLSASASNLPCMPRR